MQLVARPLGQPIANLRMFVGGVVIDDEMDLVGWRNVLIEMPQEGEKFLMAVAGLACGEHLAVGDVQGGKQGGGAMANNPDAPQVLQVASTPHRHFPHD